MQAHREQLDSLTGLRGIAACWVMLMHFREVTPTRTWEFPIFDSAIANGAYGVDVFFVLSGFIMCHVYGNTFRAQLHPNQLRQFIVYRFARIYPVHLVTFVIMLALAGVKLIISGSSGLPDRYGLVTWVTTLSLTQAWVPGIPTPNGPAWSVSAEWFAYILFPGLCLLLSYKKWAPLLYITAGVSLASFEPLRTYDLTHVLSGFLIGMASYRIMTVARWITAGPSTGLIIAATIVFWSAQTVPQVNIGLLLFAILIVTLANQRDLLSRFLSLPGILYLGEISYSLYMVHWVVRVIIRSGLQMLGILDNVPSSLVIGTYVLTSFIAAVVCYRYVELPGRSLLRKADTFYSRGRASASVIQK